jgi:hypothetical protein
MLVRLVRRPGRCDESDQVGIERRRTMPIQNRIVLVDTMGSGPLTPLLLPRDPLGICGAQRRHIAPDPERRDTPLSAPAPLINQLGRRLSRRVAVSPLPHHAPPIG